MPRTCEKEEYRADFERALKFLLGDTKSVLKELEEKMQRAAAEMNFEEAATYRDLIQSVRQVTERQKLHQRTLKTVTSWRWRAGKRMQ